MSAVTEGGVTANHPGNARIGEAVTRKEDARLLRGAGHYSDDVNLPQQAYSAALRSPHAHAQLRGIDSSAALAVPGVLTVLTGADLLADNLRPLPHLVFAGSPPNVPLVDRAGFKRFLPPHSALALSKVRFVGEIIAFVVAETLAAAKDATELIVVDYDILPAVCETKAAAAADAPRVWDDIPSNVCVDAAVGSEAETDAAFAKASHIAKIDTWIPRVTAVPMEPRAAVGVYDTASQRYTLYAGSGGSVLLRDDLSRVLSVSKDAIRVVAQEVGGSFGTKNFIYPEFVLVAWASRRLGRPVKWTCERQDAFLTDYQGRDLHVTAELAIDKEGRFLALRGCNTSNIGAYAVSMVPLQKGVQLMSGVYRIPVAHFRARGTTSNTVPTTVYRSAGRPEAIYVIERLIDIAAHQFGYDPIKLRRQNLAPSFPAAFANPLGLTYDPSDYTEVMEKTLALADWDTFNTRRQASAKLGKLRGLGLGNYIELTGGAPRERCELTVRPDGVIDLVIGTLSSGQGHETSFAQLVSEWLGVRLDCVRLKAGDTDIASVGGGTQSGRSMRFASNVTTAAFSPDGKRVMTAANDEPVHIWDAWTGATVAVLQGTNGLFVPDGSRAITFEVGKPAQIWNTTTWTSVAAFQVKGNVTHAAVSPDGMRVAVTDDNGVTIADAFTGAIVVQFRGHDKAINFIAFSPDSARILTASDDKTVRLWDASTSTSLFTFSSFPSAVNFADFLPHSNRIVTASDDGVVRLWDGDAGVQLVAFKGHPDGIKFVALSHDGSRIATGSPNLVRLWRAPPQCQELIDAARKRAPRSLSSAERLHYFIEDSAAGPQVTTANERTNCR